MVSGQTRISIRLPRETPKFILLDDDHIFACRAGVDDIGNVFVVDENDQVVRKIIVSSKLAWL